MPTIKVDQKKLKKAINELNQSELLEESLRSTGPGLSEEDIINGFIEGVERAAEIDEAKIPAYVVNVYNDIVDKMNLSTETKEEVTKDIEKAIKSADKQREKAVAAARKKTENMPVGEPPKPRGRPGSGLSEMLANFIDEGTHTWDEIKAVNPEKYSTVAAYVSGWRRGINVPKSQGTKTVKVSENGIYSWK